VGRVDRNRLYGRVMRVVTPLGIVSCACGLPERGWLRTDDGGFRCGRLASTKRVEGCAGTNVEEE